MFIVEYLFEHLKEHERLWHECFTSHDSRLSNWVVIDWGLSTYNPCDHYDGLQYQASNRPEETLNRLKREFGSDKVTYHSIDDTTYAVLFLDKNLYVDFRNRAFARAQPNSIYEGDVMDLMNVDAETEGCIELLLDEFDILTLDKVLNSLLVNGS